MLRPSPFLRQALMADAAISGATGLLMTLGSSILAGLLDLPGSLLTYAGVALLPFAGFVAWLASRHDVSKAQVSAVIVINVLWTAGSILLILSGLVHPNALGYAFVIAQAVVVGLFAEMQLIGLRKSGKPASALA